MSLVVNIAEKAVALIREYGPAARDHAAQKADDMLLAGNLYERRTWRRVQQAIGKLLAPETTDQNPRFP